MKDQSNKTRFATAGVEFTVTFGAFLAAGLLIDFYYATLPAFTMLGCVVGFLGAMYILLEKAQKIRQMANEEAEEKKKAAQEEFSKDTEDDSHEDMKEKTE